MVISIYRNIATIFITHNGAHITQHHIALGQIGSINSKVHTILGNSILVGHGISSTQINHITGNDGDILHILGCG